VADSKGLQSMKQQNHFALLGLGENETDPERIEAAYKQQKRLWDQRRHNPAYQHDWAMTQEKLACAFETLRRPEKRERYKQELRDARRRAPDASVEADYKEICEMAMGAGYLPEVLRRRLLDRARRMGIPTRHATRWLDETLIETGARRGSPAGIPNHQIKQQTFRFFVQAALRGGVLTDESSAMLTNLSREFGFSSSKLERSVDELLLLEHEPEDPGIWKRAGRVIGLLVRAEQQSHDMSLAMEPREQ